MNYPWSGGKKNDDEDKPKYAWNAPINTNYTVKEGPTWNIPNSTVPGSTQKMALSKNLMPLENGYKPKVSFENPYFKTDTQKKNIWDDFDPNKQNNTGLNFLPTAEEWSKQQEASKSVPPIVNKSAKTDTKKKKPNLFETITNGLNSAGYKGTKELLSIPKAAASIVPNIADAVLPNSVYNKKDDLLLNKINSGQEHFQKRSDTEWAKNANATGFNKIAGQGANLLGQAPEMALEFALPIPKVGTIGKALEKGAAPITDLALKLGSKFPARVAQAGIKTGTEFGLYGGLKTGLEGGKPNDMLKSAKDSAISGALFGSGSKVLGEGLKIPANISALKRSGLNQALDTKFGTPNNNLDITRTNTNLLGLQAPMPKPIKTGGVNDLGTSPYTILAGGSREFYTKPEILNPEYKVHPLVNIDRSKLNPFVNGNRLPTVKPTFNTEKVTLDPNTPNWAGQPHIFKGELNTLKDKATTTNINGISPLVRTSQPTSKIPTLNNLKQNKFPNTLLNSDRTNAGLKNNIKAADIKYNPITNKDTLLESQKLIDHDRDYAHNMVLSAKTATPVTNTVAQLLLKDMQSKGDYTSAVNLLEKVSQQNTKAGQTIQSLSMWSRLSPEGMLKYASKQYETANTKLPTNKQVKLTPTLAADITNKMNEVQKMPEGMEKNIETQKVLKTISDQIPASILKKVDTFQTMAQLLNPKTSVRNVIGNQIMLVGENAKDLIGTPLDKLVSLKTGERTTTLPSIPTQLKGYKEGFKQGIFEVKNGLPSDATQFDLPQGKVFSDNNVVGKTLNKGQKALDYMLKVPDNASKEAVRADSLRRQMKLAGVDKPTTAMLQRAEDEAKYATFQDDTKLSNAFSKGKQALNLNQDFGLGSMVAKYPKTPANLINRSLAYSPAGFLKAGGEVIKPLVKRGEFSQKSFVDSTARAALGTGVMGGAYELANIGILTGKPDSDKDTSSMSNMAGLGAYKLNINALNRYVGSGFNANEAKPQKGDKLVNYDWLQPSSASIAAGSNIATNKSKGGVLARGYNSTIAGADTILNQPLMSGLSDYYNKLHDKGFVEGNLSVAGDIPQSMTPTVLKQVAQTVDNKTRNSYNLSPFKQSLNKVQAKIPILSKELQPKYDTFGNPVKAYESNNLLNVFLNPANVSTYKPSEAAKLPLNIFNKTGDRSAMPQVTPNFIKNNGETIKLTEKENAELQKYVGQQVFVSYSSLANDPNFKDMSEEDQATKMQKILKQINKEGKDIILQGRKK